MSIEGEEMTRIYILGGPGSGKTTLAKRLSRQLNIPCYEMLSSQRNLSFLLLSREFPRPIAQTAVWRLKLRNAGMPEGV